MHVSSVIAPLFVFAGLVAGAARAAPVPPRELAEAQLRAINHRFVESFVVANAEFMDVLTGEDFVQTAIDGSWQGRAEFVAEMRTPAPLDGATYDDVRVRLFGPVALVHAVFEALHRDGKVARVRYTDVYAWNGAAWRLVSGNNTLRQGRRGRAPADGNRARARAVAGSGPDRRRHRRPAERSTRTT